MCVYVRVLPLSSLILSVAYSIWLRGKSSLTEAKLQVPGIARIDSRSSVDLLYV